MRPEQLSDALNYLEEDLIAEAAAVRDHSKARRPSWQKWGALAACLAVAVFAGTRLLPGEALPKPGNPPRPGASGPSQPVQGGELPTLTIQWDTSGGMGFEGYMAFDIAELGGNNPWTEEAELSTLPVYKNPLTYDEQHRATGANWRRMKALLLDVAGKLGLDTQNLPITDNTPSQEQQQAIREKFAAVGDTVPEGYFDPTTLIIEGEGVTVEVDQTLTASIDFAPPVALPEGYNFTHYATRAEKRKAADWLSSQYYGLVSGMAKPLLDQGMGDRNIYSQQSFDVEYYDGAGSLEEQMVSYSFYRTAFYCDDNGELFLAPAAAGGELRHLCPLRHAGGGAHRQGGAGLPHRLPRGNLAPLLPVFGLPAGGGERGNPVRHEELRRLLCSRGGREVYRQYAHLRRQLQLLKQKTALPRRPASGEGLFSDGLLFRLPGQGGGLLCSVILVGV